MAVQQWIIQRLEARESLDHLSHPLAKAAARATRPTAIKNALSGRWLGHPLHPIVSDMTS